MRHEVIARCGLLLPSIRKAKMYTAISEQGRLNLFVTIPDRESLVR